MYSSNTTYDIGEQKVKILFLFHFYYWNNMKLLFRTLKININI